MENKPALNPHQKYCSECGRVMNRALTACPFCGSGKETKSGGTNTVLIVIASIVGGGFFLMAIIGILAALAIPNFIKFQAKAKQAEAKVSLAKIHTMQNAYRGQYRKFSDSLLELGFESQGISRYSYFLTPDNYILKEGIDIRNIPAEYKDMAFAQQDQYLAVAIGNIDADPDLDVWIIDNNKNLRNIKDDAR